MPSSSSVHEQLTDILVRVVGCPADAVVPEARLNDLGTDSLTVVEVGEELGRRFGVHLSDDTIDALVTVKDAIAAVVRHDGSQAPRSAPSVPAFLDTPAAPTDEVETVYQDDDERRGKATSFLLWFALIGAIVGGVLGIGGAALFSATGISAADLPPISAPTTPEPTETATTTAPTASPTETTGTPEPTIQVSSTQVSPGEKFTLTGVFPGSDTGEKLQVEVKDDGAPWDDFPIQPQTRDGGTFKTELYTSRTGTREFRVTNTVTDVSSPSVKVEIG